MRLFCETWLWGFQFVTYNRQMTQGIRRNSQRVIQSQVMASDWRWRPSMRDQGQRIINQGREEGQSAWTDSYIVECRSPAIEVLHLWHRHLTSHLHLFQGTKIILCIHCSSFTFYINMMVNKRAVVYKSDNERAHHHVFCERHSESNFWWFDSTIQRFDLRDFAKNKTVEQLSWAADTCQMMIDSDDDNDYDDDRWSCDELRKSSTVKTQVGTRSLQ